MREVGYWVGVGLLLAAAAVGVAEILTIMQGAPSRLSFGAMWHRLHPNSLLGFQALIEQDLSPVLWPPVRFLLSTPAWLILLPPGLLLVVACRPRSRF